MKRLSLLLGVFVLGIVIGSIMHSDAAGVDLDTLAKQVALQDRRITALETQVSALSSALKVGTADVELRSSGTLTLKGAIVKLNGGGTPLARVGDSVQVTCSAPGATVTGKVVSGSPTVLGN